jgi:hypothetical protein
MLAEHFDLAGIIGDLERTGHELSNHQVVAIVFHHPRQTQLGMMLTGKNPRNWLAEPEPGYAEAICLEARTLVAFTKGEGIEYARIWADAKQL